MRQRAQAGRIAAVLAAVMVVGLSAGCSDSTQKSSTASAAGSMAAPAQGAAPGGGLSGDSAPNQPAKAPSSGQGQNSNLAKAPVAGRSLVYTATLTVRTKNIAAATSNAETLAASNGGFVGTENTQSGTVPDTQGATQSTVTLRVPSTAFDRVLGQLGSGGVVQNETRSASDVTAQVVDTSTRVTAQQASIARITDLIKGATNLSDVVTLENELSRREADLESMQAQLAALNDQVSLSTITVTFLVPDAPAPAANPVPKHQNALQRGLHDGWVAFSGTVKVLLVVLGVVLPFAVTAVVLWWPVSWIVARVRARQARMRQAVGAGFLATVPAAGSPAASAAAPPAAPPAMAAQTASGDQSGASADPDGDRSE
jgi:hypothetical protein